MKPKLAKPSDAALDPPDLETHDEVYFRHAMGPKCGKVLARGMHGFTADSGGERHKVRWEHYLGHKVRVRPSVRVVDQGVDGLIVADNAGRRRYIHDPIDDMKPMAKSLAPVVLFFAAESAMLKAIGRDIKNRPGLTLQTVTDKRGVVTKRWKATGGKPPAHGDKVSFKTGDGAKGAGAVQGKPGEDGVHVRSDKDGRIHQVLDHEIKEHEPVADGTGETASPKAPDTELSQPTTSRDELFEQSGPALESLREWLNKGAGFCDKLGFTTMGKAPDQMTAEEWDAPGGKLFIAPLKGADRSEEKVAKDYKGDWSKLLDTVRGMIVVDTLDDLQALRDKLKTEGMFVLAKPEKDRYAKPTREGYRDVLMNIRFPNGIIGELQVNVAEMAKAKDLIGHPLYEKSRTIVGNYSSDADPADFSPEDNRAFWDAVEGQRTAYTEAWAKISHKNDKNTGKTA